MEPFARDYLEILEKYHHELANALEGLPQAALDWAPGPEMSPLAVLVVHVAGAERYWLSDVIRGEPSHRDRAAEFQVKGLSAETLLARLADGTAYAREVVDGLTLADLQTSRVSPRDGSQVTVAWALDNLLAHMASHAGHAGITRQLWEQRHASEQAPSVS